MRTVLEALAALALFWLATMAIGLFIAPNDELWAWIRRKRRRG